MNDLHDDERRLRIATAAYRLVVAEVRPHIASGGRLWSKGSRGYPSGLRRMLSGLDSARAVSFGTRDAMRLPASDREV